LEEGDCEFAADFFLNLVLGRVTCLALYGIATNPNILELRRRAAVEFFLKGVHLG
jgi:hypothetical protein